MTNQWWDQFATAVSSGKKAKQGKNKPIEALKDNVVSAATNTEDLGKNKIDLEKRYRELARFQTERARREERELYNREKRETAKQIQLLQQEIEALKEGVEQLDHQLEVASQQNIVNPSVYDVNFLQKLVVWLRNFRAKVEDASIWLSVWNQKGKKRGAFWGLVASKKGGAKFFLSSEHYLTRSAG